MQSVVTEIAPDLYRISTFRADMGMQFNQFLLNDEEPFLMHTGLKRMFPATREAIASVVDPAKLRWIGFSHFEADECGALDEFLRIAPRAEAACGAVGAYVSVNDFAARPARPLADWEALETGRYRLRFLATPHVPHCWDAGLFFEEANRTLLCSDLFFHPADPAPLTDADVVEPARDAILKNLTGPMAKDMPYTPYTDATLKRLAALAPRTLAVMHGSSFRGDGAKALGGLADVLKDTLARQV
ncbi:MAG TPA: MBL fold metallo-hydrolase [Candidatus Binatia bacterium]